MASQSMAAHIMKPVVSISMSPDSCSSADRTGAAGTRAGAAGGVLFDKSVEESWAIARWGDLLSASFAPIMAQMLLESMCAGPPKRLEFRIPESEHPHVDGRPRRLHLVRRQARALARGQ